MSLDVDPACLEVRRRFEARFKLLSTTYGFGPQRLTGLLNRAYRAASQQLEDDIRLLLSTTCEELLNESTLLARS